MSDICDMGKYFPGQKNSRYFQLILYEGSQYRWIFLLKKKHEANENIMRLIANLLAQYIAFKDPLAMEVRIRQF